MGDQLVWQGFFAGGERVRDELVAPDDIVSGMEDFPTGPYISLQSLLCLGPHTGDVWISLWRVERGSCLEGEGEDFYAWHLEEQDPLKVARGVQDPESELHQLLVQILRDGYSEDLSNDVYFVLEEDDYLSSWEDDLCPCTVCEEWLGLDEDEVDEDTCFPDCFNGKPCEAIKDFLKYMRSLGVRYRLPRPTPWIELRRLREKVAHTEN